MIAETTETVATLNTRARSDRITAGHVDPAGEVRLHDGTGASTGDLIITRRNDRRLLTGSGWVRNGDRWTITTTHDDGSVTVRRDGHRRGTSVRLPAWYVADHVELAYAITVHRTQGSTVETTHTLVQPTMTRETLYVAMTRGRHANTAYVATDQPDAETHHQHPDVGEVTSRSVLFGVLQHVGAEVSAHQTIEAEHQAWSGIAQLAAEYETIAAAAQHDRWAGLIERSGLTREQIDAVLASDAFGALAAELRRAEANYHDVDRLLPRLIAARSLEDADDVAAVLHHRLVKAATRRMTAAVGPRRAPRLIVGLIPEATGPMTDEMRRSLDERRNLIEQRAYALTEAAVADQTAWPRVLGGPPRDSRRRDLWIRHARTIAAYRDRYQIASDTPLGPAPDTTAQRIDAARAHTALLRAQRLSGLDQAPPSPDAAVRTPTGRRRGPSL